MLRADAASPKWYIPFFSIWSGQVFSLLGSGIAQFAVIWWLTQETGSGTVLAAASLAGLLPGVILGPLAGAYVDRWNRRRVMIVADSLIALVSLWLAYQFWSGAVQIWNIYLVVFLRSIGGAFHWPAMQASTTLMVPNGQLTRVAGMNQTLYGLIGIVSPPLGALLLAWIPIAGILMMDVLTALIAVLPLLFVLIPQPVRSDADSATTRPSVWSDFKAGLRYVWGWPGALALLGMAMVINFLLTPASTLMPLLVVQHFQGGALQLAWVESAWGVGMVAGGVFLSIWGGFKRRMHTSLMGLAMMGVGCILVGVAPAWALWIAVAGYFVAGFFNPITNGPLFAILQATVAPEMQGRVFTLIGSLSGLMSPLSLAVAGPVADLTGVRPWFWLAGILCILMGVGSFFIPLVVNLEDKAGSTEAQKEMSYRG